MCLPLWAGSTTRLCTLQRVLPLACGRPCHLKAHDMLMRREHTHDTFGSFRTQLQSPCAPSMLLPRRIPCPCGHASLPCNECPPCALGPISPCLGSPRSPRALKRACCLEKPCQWPTTRLTLRGSPMPPTQCCPSKGTHISLSPCNVCSTCALGPFLGLSRSSQALDRACCLGKTCQWLMLQLAPGAHPCHPSNAAHIKAHKCPSSSTLPIERHMDVYFPHATSALLARSVSSWLVEEPSSPRSSMLPWKNVPMGNVALTSGAHPCLPPNIAHRKAHECPPPLSRATSALLVHLTMTVFNLKMNQRANDNF